MFVPTEVLYHQHAGTVFAYALDKEGDQVIGAYRKTPVREGEAVEEWSPDDFDWENAEPRLPQTEPVEHPDTGEVVAPDPDRERYIAAVRVLLRKGEV